MVFLTLHRIGAAIVRHARPGLRALLLAALVAVALVSTARAEDSAPEAALKAAFVFNFTKFVDWPGAENLEKFSLCTAGSSLTVDALGAFEGKLALGKPIHVVRGAQGAALRNCQLLFVAEPWSAAYGEMLNDVRNSATLTVSDSANFLDAGGIIMLVREGGRLRFEINLGLAQTKGLKVGAPLLRLARSVRETH